LQFKNVCLRFSFYLILGNKCQFVPIVPILLGSMSAHQKITTGVDLTVYLHPLWVFFNLTSSFPTFILTLTFLLIVFCSFYLSSPLITLNFIIDKISLCQQEIANNFHSVNFITSSLSQCDHIKRLQLYLPFNQFKKL
jgi:hypothetical protein